MITPKEKIEKFHNKDFYLHSELAVDLAKTENVELVDKLKLTLALITTIIEEYNDVLGEVVKSSYDNFGIRCLLRFKIQQWKELLNNK